MAEILYQYSEKAGFSDGDIYKADIRWLDAEDYPIFARHLELCGQAPISEEKWREICREGTVYCGLFVDGEMVARACREILSPELWEIADVRVVRNLRNRGYALEICRFVLAHILSEGKTPSIRTEDDNFPMQRVIQKLGFVSMETSE